LNSRLARLLTNFRHKIKMNQGRVSASYARALWGWANDKGLTTQVYEQSIKLLEFAKQNPDFIELLNSKGVPASKKQTICLAVSSRLTPDLSSIISLHIKNKRESSLTLTMLQYQNIYREKKGVLKVVVVSASKLSAKLVNGIKEFLHSKLSKNIEMEQDVNPELIGGFTLTIGDKYLDKSVKGELEVFRKKLLGII